MCVFFHLVFYLQGLSMLHHMSVLYATFIVGLYFIDLICYGMESGNGNLQSLAMRNIPGMRSCKPGF